MCIGRLFFIGDGVRQAGLAMPLGEFPEAVNIPVPEVFRNGLFGQIFDLCAIAGKSASDKVRIELERTGIGGKIQNAARREQGKTRPAQFGPVTVNVQGFDRSLGI